MMKNLIAKKVIGSITELTIKLLIVTFCIFFLNMQFVEMRSAAVPITLVPQEKIVVDDRTEKALKLLGAPPSEVKELTRAVKIASSATSFHERLCVALMYTESTFKKDAISSKGYKGLMQTPTATFKYAAVDTLHGMSILRDYYNITGNLEDALTLYKGGKLTNVTARVYAKETIRVYRDLIRKVG